MQIARLLICKSGIRKARVILKLQVLGLWPTTGPASSVRQHIHTLGTISGKIGPPRGQEQTFIELHGHMGNGVLLRFGVGREGGVTHRNGFAQNQPQTQLPCGIAPPPTSGLQISQVNPPAGREGGSANRQIFAKLGTGRARRT